MIAVFALTFSLHLVAFGFGLYIHKTYESKFVNCGKKYLLLMTSLFVNFSMVIYLLPRVYALTENIFFEVFCLIVGACQIYLLYLANIKLRKGKKDAGKNV